MLVLIVDDNDQSLYLLRSVLEGAGHKTCPASDGAEALACALKEIPDAVITDILMPRMDGFAFCRALREHEHERLRHLPILLYSATYTDAKDRELGLALGADRFLEKPMEPSDLLAELEASVNERRDGARPVTGAALGEPEFLREYNERLVRKLEDRMLDLERAFRELAESERRYHELFDVASDVIITFGEGGTITLVNRRIQETLGVHPAEVAGRPGASLVVPSARAQVESAFERALAGQRTCIEVDFLSADGRPVPMSLVLVPLWQGRRPNGLMGIARDISERARQEASRLEEAKKAARSEGKRRLAEELEAPLVQVASAARELAGRPGMESLADQLTSNTGTLTRALDVARRA
jgi:two-component system cell cycle sensor histidine kinase/response regulator CckA